MAAPSCAPCVFGAAVTSTIVLPFQVIGTTIVVEYDRVLSGNITSRETDTFTTGAPTAPPGQILATTTLEVNHSTALTTSTLGTVLTFGTQYVSYGGFRGAAAPSACAQTLTPTLLTLPTDAGPSLIYPDSAGLPPALLAYLDGPASFPAQLDGDQVTECAALPSVLPVPTIAPFDISSASITSSSATPSPSSTFSSLSSSVSATTISSSVSSLSSSLVPPFTSTNATTISSGPPVPPSSTAPNSTVITTSVSVSTSAITTVTSAISTSTTVLTTTTSTSPATVTTNLPPPTTFTTNSAETITTSTVVPTELSVTYTPVNILSTISGSSIYGPSATYQPPQPQLLSSSSSVAPSDIGQLLSALASLSAYGSITSSSASSTSSTASTGSSTPATSVTVSPVTTSPPYPYNNATTFTSTSTASNGSVVVTPYTGAANRVMQPIGMGWYEALAGLAMPLLFW